MTKADNITQENVYSFSLLQFLLGKFIILNDAFKFIILLILRKQSIFQLRMCQRQKKYIYFHF